MNEEAGRGKDVSITVTSTGGDIVAERPMYFDFRGNITGGHDVIGASAPSQDWYFAEGCTGYGIEEWLCLQNPNTSAATVDITYMMKAGHTLTRQVTVAAKSRKTLNVNDHPGLLGQLRRGGRPSLQGAPGTGASFYNNVVQALASVGCNRELVATEIGWPNYSCNPIPAGGTATPSRPRPSGTRVWAACWATAAARSGSSRTWTKTPA